MKKLVKISASALLILLVAVSLASCGMPSKAQEEKKLPAAVIITSPQAQNIVRTVRFSGTLKGSREVMVYPPLPGKFMGYAVSEGSYVSKGSTVARLDRDVPGVAYEPVPIEAPISGRFFYTGTDQGEMIAPQMPIGRVSETSVLNLGFSIPEKYISNVEQGSRAEVYVPAADYRAEAALVRVSRFVDQRSGTAQAEASVSNQSGALAPGMFAEISVIVAQKKAALALPIDCVLGLDGKFVYVLLDSKTEKIEGKTYEVGKVVKRDVEVGLEDGNYQEIVSGLTAQDKVLYVGQRIVEEGAKVRVTGAYNPAESGK